MYPIVGLGLVDVADIDEHGLEVLTYQEPFSIDFY